MRTAKFCLNYALLLVCICALLAMHWTNTHVHLAEHHTHEGSHHEHQIEAHAHHLSNHHAAVIDSSQPYSHVNIIDLDHEYGFQQTEQQRNFSSAIAFSNSLPARPSLPLSTKIPFFTKTTFSHLDRSTVKPRAPPKTA